MRKLILIVILLFAVGWTMESEASQMGLSPPGVEQLYVDVETQIAGDIVAILVPTPKFSVRLINMDAYMKSVMELTEDTKSKNCKQEREAIGLSNVNMNYTIQTRAIADKTYLKRLSAPGDR